MSTSDLPSVNAALNASSAGFLLLGYFFIRRQNVPAHRMCMLAAFGGSIVFLLSYIVYHSVHGSTGYTGQGWLRPVYFFILFTHTVLAAINLPLVLATLYRALRGRYDRHRHLARWALPIWVYVSVTGVAVYLMLYHMH